ncbi:MAG: ASPIC/UnbV domain-containing protein, partial [Akkermansiaceae bacterium]
EISHLSGADSDGDGRGVVAADFRKNGKMDLVVRQAGGGPLRIYENQFPAGNFLEVRLRGTSSNRLGVGAKLTVIIGDRTIYRNQFPENSYRSQAPNTVHFGLGEATTVDELRVEWPSGKSTVLKGISSNQHMEIFEE